MANHASKIVTRYMSGTFLSVKDLESNYMLHTDLAIRVPEPGYLIFWFFPPIETGGNRCEYAPQNVAMGDPARPDNLTRRKSQNMQDSQVKVGTESQPTEPPAQGPKTKSSFNNAEYERWSAKLRNRNGSKHT
jgi:hypothetical protein